MVEEGHIAVVHVVGRIASGEEAGAVFETSDVDVALAEGVYEPHRDYEPVEFRVGAGTVLPGIEDAVRSMAVGETRTVTLSPAEAYGPRDSRRVVTLPREPIEERSGVTAEPGELVADDRGTAGWIADVSTDAVTVDFNHELAGERVEFEVRVLDERRPDGE